MNTYRNPEGSPCLFVAPTARPGAGPDVTLSNTDVLPPDLEAKLNTILKTATVHNDVFAAANPRSQRLSDPKIGPILRVALWDIERGFQLDLMKQALVEPGKFEEAVDAGKQRTESQRWNYSLGNLARAIRGANQLNPIV
jgi:hypothetical protein